MRHAQAAGVKLSGWADAQAAWAGARKPWATQAQRGKVRKRLFCGARQEIQRCCCCFGPPCCSRREVHVTALTALLFLSGISVSFTYENCGVRHFLRTDTTFDIVQCTYIHGGLSLEHAGTCVAPRSRRTVHRTHMHAHPSHASRHAEHASLFFVHEVHRGPEREGLADLLARPAGARHSARRLSIGRSTRKSLCARRKARDER